MLITNYLEDNASKFPGEVALVELNPEAKENGIDWKEAELVEPKRSEAYRKELTWGEFEDRANRTANYFISLGIKKGDKVALLLMNCIEWLPIYFGILKSGALAVPLNYRYTADEIAYCMDLSDSIVLIFGPEFLSRIEEINGNMPNVPNMVFVGQGAPAYAENYEESIHKMPATKPAVEIAPTDEGAIYFSSGTTGFPKAILHSHASIISACITEQAHHNQQKDDVFLCIPPLYHTGAKMHWFGSLVSASKAVILKGTRAEWIMDALSSEKCSIVWLLVPWCQDILDAIDAGQINLAEHNLDRLRLMHIGAQPVPPSLVKRWKAFFPHHEYDTNYGLSESLGPGCVHLGVENIHKVGAIGVAGHEWETKILDEDFNEVECGKIGELAVKGPGVMLCYYKNEDATAECLRGDWLMTGDMAMEDEDGFIFLVDRKKDVVISGGENIYPVQIEDFLRNNDKIKDVAVIGIPDNRLGEITLAIIELKAGAESTIEEMDEFCNGLPRYKRPRKIIFEEVPRNPTGKIEKPKLRDKYAGGAVVAKQVSS
ncbi:MAG: AMP-binding protein [Eubacteriaceae bacterium]|nr:AMP-binding protein [Eubacteriaceae bacterium]